MSRDNRKPFSVEALGLFYGLAAYSLWGLFPLYWKRLDMVPATQILAHRIVWAFIFTLALCFILGRKKDLAELFHSPKRLASTFAAGLLISLNWGVYIWAVNQSRIIETSLGYYLNPLLSAAMGAFVLREKLDKGMVVAYCIAGFGIVVLTVSYGKLPWVALTLALSFAFYGLIKKIAALDALTGLTVETGAAFPFALAFLVFEQRVGRGAFGTIGATGTIMLFMAGVVTAIPLLLYASGVKRLALSKMGFLQYLSPTLQLILGVFVFGEVVDLTQGIAFGCVVTALLVFGFTRRKIKTVKGALV
jgi:chloramphenicol-sensitive protein RarD